MNEISDDVSMAPETMNMGGAPPHTDTRIRPEGGSKIGQFKKRGATALRSLSLLLLLFISLQLAQGRPGRSAGLSP